jgi:hypothetical protein
MPYFKLYRKNKRETLIVTTKSYVVTNRFDIKHISVQADEVSNAIEQLDTETCFTNVYEVKALKKRTGRLNIANCEAAGQDTYLGVAL